MRRTKIVATLGPSTDRKRVLEDMIKAGLDCARVNFSHGSLDDARQRIERTRQAAHQQGRTVGVLCDLQGPKIRIERFREGSVTLRNGGKFRIDPRLDPDSGDEEQVGVTYKALPGDVQKGDTLLLDDGHIVLRVENVGNDIQTRVVAGGKLSDSKGVNRRGGGLSAAALTDKDRADIAFAGQMDVDYLAVSFPRDRDDIEHARELFCAAGGSGHIVAKIERAEALANIREIIDASDAIMIARGDLGVEVGDAELPGVQKRIIREARARNGVVITATQMMQSMVDNPQPTRAEVLDVANAVLDGTDAVMLSAETAVGRHPARVVASMDGICNGAESHYDTMPVPTRDDQFDNAEEAIAMAAMYIANRTDVGAIIALTESGATARSMSRISSQIPIYAFTPHESTQRRVTMYRGVYPVNYSVDVGEYDSVDRALVDVLIERGTVKAGERIVITRGERAGVAGGTNTLKIVMAGRD